MQSTQKAIKCPKMIVGTNNFKKMLLSKDFFIDKSLLIKDIINSNCTLCLITRSNGLGKSVNISRMKQFFELPIDDEGKKLEKNPNTVLFQGGEIMNGNGDIIYLNPLEITQDSN